MIKNILLFLAGGLVVGAIVFIWLLSNCEDDWCFYFNWQRVRNTRTFVECVNRGFPIINNRPRQCQAGTKIFTETNTPTPEPEVTNIHVFEPIAYDSVGSPFTIRGEARVFENIVHYRLKDGDGNILAQNTTEAQSSDVGTYGSFAFAVSYVTNRNLSLELEIFTLSAKDGSEIEKITIPLTAKF